MKMRLPVKILSAFLRRMQDGERIEFVGDDNMKTF
uniref:Uncharacterized protein n=1 Tax=Rhizophora mucronata TaxID=61149 RepID=A0A2P2MRW4_RHIMU